MPVLQTARRIDLTADLRTTLVRLTRRPTVAAGLARRARIVLLAAEGAPIRQIARQVGLAPAGVRRWLDRFRADGIAGLSDRPRSGRPRAFPP